MNLLIKNLNKLKKGLMYKHKFCILEFSLITDNFLKILLKYNLIRKYTVINKFKKKLIRIKYTYYNNNPLTKKLIIFSRKQTNTFKYSNIKYLKIQESFCIFSTNKGILTTNDCKLYQKGGLILCKIYI